MITYDFKYRTELQMLEDQGIFLPQLYIPESKTSFRYVFSDKPEKNHLPVYIQTPKRAINAADKNKLTAAGFSLSCFENEEKAIIKYNEYKSHSPNIKNTLGDSLSTGIIDKTDGLITTATENSHFELFEFSTCDLSKKFQIKKTLG